MDSKKILSSVEEQRFISNLQANTDPKVGASHQQPINLFEFQKHGIKANPIIIDDQSGEIMSRMKSPPAAESLKQNRASAMSQQQPADAGPSHAQANNIIPPEVGGPGHEETKENLMQSPKFDPLISQPSEDEKPRPVDSTMISATAVRAAQAVLKTNQHWVNWQKIFGEEGPEQSAKVSSSAQMEQEIFNLEVELNTLNNFIPHMEVVLNDEFESLRKEMDDNFRQLSKGFESKIISTLMPKFLVDVEKLFQESETNLVASFKKSQDEIMNKLDAKISKFKDLNAKVVETYKKMMYQHKAFSTNLQNQLMYFQSERTKFEKEKQVNAQLKNILKSDVIKLNVGGTHSMVSTRGVLTSVRGSLLRKLFSGQHELQQIDGQVFIDREPKIFELLVTYLRNDRKIWPEFTDEAELNLFLDELKHWGISDDTYQELNIQKRFNSDLVMMLKETPGEINGEEGERGGETISDEALFTWKKLGPIQLLDIQRHSKHEADPGLGFVKSKGEEGEVIYGQGKPVAMSYFGSLADIVGTKRIGDEALVHDPAMQQLKENKTLQEYMDIINSLIDLQKEPDQDQKPGGFPHQTPRMFSREDQSEQELSVKNIFAVEALPQNQSNHRNPREEDPAMSANASLQTGTFVVNHSSTSPQSSFHRRGGRSYQFRRSRAEGISGRQSSGTYQPSMAESARFNMQPTTLSSIKEEGENISIQGLVPHSKRDSEGVQPVVQLEPIGICRIIFQALPDINRIDELPIAIYEGQINDKGEFHGLGRVIYANGNCYYGQFEHGQFNGHGKFYIFEGTQQSKDKEKVVAGEWEEGKMIQRLKTIGF